MKHSVRFSEAGLRLVLALFLWLTGVGAHAQAPAWQAAVALGNTSSSYSASYMATDASGDVYLAGSFSGTLAFSNTVLTAASSGNAGYSNFYVARWSPTRAAFVWAVQGGGAVGATAQGLAVSGGSVYVTGGAAAGSTFGNVAATGSGQLFVAKLGSGTGAFTWAMLTGGNGYISASALAVSGSSLYLTGSFGGSVTVGATTLTTISNQEAFVAKVTDAGSSGSVTWAVRSVGGDTNTQTYGNALAVAGNSVYVAGSYQGIVGFGGTALTSAGYAVYQRSDAFVAKLTDAGSSASFTWAQSAGGTSGDQATALTASGSSVYVGGQYDGTATFGTTTLTGAGNGDVFISKLTDAGSGSSFAWTKTMGGAYTDALNALVVSGSSLYALGTFSGTASFGTTTFTEAGGALRGDLFVTSLLDAGSTASFAWTQQAGGTNREYPYGLALSGGTLYASGITSSNPAAFGSLSLAGSSGYTSFLAALGAPTLNLVAPAGPAGSSVVLYGEGLTGATAVSFNGQAASGFSVNAAGTQLTVAVPGGATTGPVTVTNAFGTSNSVNYTVAPANPAPAWQALAPATQAYGNLSYAQATATDASGNVYVAGYFSGAVSFGSTTLYSAGSVDMFVAKYSPDTNSYLWAQRAGGAGTDILYGVAVSGSSVYLTGYFFSPTATFGSLSLTNADATGNTADAFVAKLTDAGNSASFTWVQRISGSSAAGGGTTAYNDVAYGVAASGGSVYLTGYFPSTYLNLGSLVLANPTAPSHTYVAKLTDAGSTGSFTWAQAASGGANYPNAGIAVNGVNIYVAGYFSGTTPVAFGSATLTNADATGKSTDVFVAKLTDAGSTGSFTWAQQVGGSGSDYGARLAVSGSNVYVSGYFYGPTTQVGSTTLPNADAAGTTSDIFIARFSDAGSTSSFAWAQRLGGSDYDIANGLAVRGANVYVGGYFYSPSLPVGTTTLYNTDASASIADAFVAQLTDAGSSAGFDWGQAGGGPGSDIVQALAVTGSAVFAAGTLNPTAAFGSQAVTGPFAGGSAAFVAAISNKVLASATPAAPAAARTLYPNPAHGTATVQLPAGATTLLVLDALGRELRRQPVAAGAPTEATLDLRGLAAGLYLVRVLGGGPAATHRLVVE